MNNELNAVMAAGSNPENMPEKKVYEVGETIKLINEGYGHVYGYRDSFQMFDISDIRDGNQVLEVEVKSVKTAKTVLE